MKQAMMMLRSSVFTHLIAALLGYQLGLLMNAEQNFSDEADGINVQYSSTKTNTKVQIHPSSSKGFHPVYVYSQANSTSKLEDKPFYSQAKQDLVILALTEANDDKLQPSSDLKKYFVDLAANDASHLSNTLLLERNGWSGVCIEPNPVYWYRLASYRSCTVVGAFVGGVQEKDGEEVDVNLKGGELGGIVGEEFDNKKESDAKRNLVSIKTTFEENKVPKTIDFLSLDVEGAEALVMRNFPWDLYKFKFLTIERPKDDLVQMLNEHGYEKVKNVTYWGETLWVHKESVALTKNEIESIIVEKDLECC